MTGPASAGTVALNDRHSQSVQGEDMIANVFDTSTTPWTDITSKFTISPGSGITSTDGTGSGHTLLVIWFKRRIGLG